MFKSLKQKKQDKLNSLSTLNRTEEYKDLSIMEIIYCTRYCNKRRKQLKTPEDVKRCFDEALERLRSGKANNKLEDNNA